MNEKYKFPKGFLWGASTASHQVEGGTYNQWTVWELQHAAELAKTAPKRLGKLPNWERVKAQATDPNNYVSGTGVDHYNRYKEDFGIAKQLNLNAFRFSIEWSRIEPSEGAWDEAEIAHYKEYIHELKTQGLEPFLNIWHWTNPTWFEEKGGFSKRANQKYFLRFVEKVAQELCSEVKFVLVLNEATSYITGGYILGDWPPGHRSPLWGIKVYYYLALIQRRAYKLLKKQKPSLQVGIAHPVTSNVPKNPNSIIDILACRIANYWDEWFYNRIRKYQDFIGFNFYYTNVFSAWRLRTPANPLNDLGWYMDPGQLYNVALRLSNKYKKPIYVTESGVADSEDQYRQWWIDESIKAIGRAIKDGADIRGYFHWSLLDNFEWAYGWWPEFGLVHVDRENGMKRTIRPSAKWFAQEVKKLH